MTMASVVVVAIVLVCAITDLRYRKIYNWVTLPAMATGLLYHAYWGGLSGVAASLGGLAFGISILIIPFLLGGTGAGDSKLLGALGVWLQLPTIVYVFIVAGLVCGAVSLLFLFVKHTHLLRHPLMAIASLRFGILPIPEGTEQQRELPPVLQKSFALPFALLVALGVGVVMFFDLAEY